MRKFDYFLLVLVLVLYVGAGTGIYVAYDKYKQLESTINVVKKIVPSDRKWWWQ